MLLPFKRFPLHGRRLPPGLKPGVNESKSQTFEASGTRGRQPKHLNLRSPIPSLENRAYVLR